MTLPPAEPELDAICWIEDPDHGPSRPPEDLALLDDLLASVRAPGSVWLRSGALSCLRACAHVFAVVRQARMTAGNPLA